jgi:hypothetical protein
MLKSNIKEDENNSKKSTIAYVNKNNCVEIKKMKITEVPLAIETWTSYQLSFVLFLGIHFPGNLAVQTVGKAIHSP